MNRNLLQLIMFRAYTSVKAEMSRNYLGFIWWLIEPILYMGAFYMLFGMGLRTGGPGFIEFLLVGITAWKWFGACLAASTFVVSANKSLIDNSAVNKIIFPLSMILANTFKHMFIVVLLLTFLVFSGNTVFVTWWYLPWY